MEMASAEENKNSTSKLCYLATVVIRFVTAVMFILTKIAFDGGMNNSIFVFYRQTTATLFLLPFALFYGREAMPPLSFQTFCKIFMLSFIGITLGMNLVGFGLADTSATITSASTNSVPAITFFLAVLLRVETLKWGSKSGAAKIAGIAICLGGIATLAFYSGSKFSIFSNGWRLIKVPQVSDQSGKTWVGGCFLLVAGAASLAFWIVLQGIMVTGVGFYLQSFVIERKGPVFLSSTQPLELVFTMLGSALLLGQAVRSGSVIGGVLLVGGLYMVLWGKHKEASCVEKENAYDNEMMIQEIAEDGGKYHSQIKSTV